eukprot:TRINITY_DN82_c4_g1_i1.p1 TRINITY_DN82_c4_g1~~TRINITY_DN82_c4_g1_i1.p1  ORF type:complete len:228 (-),score=81.30 TRINITY_DN82_c4_g1_i1:63-746(-)
MYSFHTKNIYNGTKSSAAFYNPYSSVRMWHFFDATGLRLGRLANKIAPLLQGKHKPVYLKSRDIGDYVVVVNMKNIVLTGNKWDKKLYRWHTGFVGHLREYPAKDIYNKYPQRMLQRAVFGMLPKNPTRRTLMTRLHIFVDDEHPYTSQLTTFGTNQLIIPRKNKIKKDDYEPLGVVRVSDTPEAIKISVERHPKYPDAKFPRFGFNEDKKKWHEDTSDDFDEPDKQ